MVLDFFPEFKCDWQEELELDLGIGVSALFASPVAADNSCGETFQAEAVVHSVDGDDSSAQNPANSDSSETMHSAEAAVLEASAACRLNDDDSSQAPLVDDDEMPTLVSNFFDHDQLEQHDHVEAHHPTLLQVVAQDIPLQLLTPILPFPSSVEVVQGQLIWNVVSAPQPMSLRILSSPAQIASVRSVNPSNPSSVLMPVWTSVNSIQPVTLQSVSAITLSATTVSSQPINAQWVDLQPELLNATFSSNIEDDSVQHLLSVGRVPDTYASVLVQPPAPFPISFVNMGSSTADQIALMLPSSLGEASMAQLTQLATNISMMAELPVMMQCASPSVMTAAFATQLTSFSPLMSSVNLQPCVAPTLISAAQPQPFSVRVLNTAQMNAQVVTAEPVSVQAQMPLSAQTVLPAPTVHMVQAARVGQVGQSVSAAVHSIPSASIVSAESAPPFQEAIEQVATENRLLAAKVTAQESIILVRFQANFCKSFDFQFHSMGI